MLRISKDSLGVLDLSQVKDEHGHPVILSGKSHRDVPDHEMNNEILQRVVDAGWVTVKKLSVTAVLPEPPPTTVTVAPPPDETPKAETGLTDTSAATDEPSSNEDRKANTSDKPGDKSDSRKPGRRG